MSTKKSSQKTLLKNTLCWIRNDIRYHDNEVLHWAHENSERITPVFVFDPRLFTKTHKFGFPKTGPFRAKFLVESVHDLSRALKSRGSNLLVFQDKPETVIHSLHSSMNFDAVVFQKEVTKEETDVEDAVEAICKSLNVKFISIWGSTLYHLDDLPFNIRDLPDTYTEFRKIVELRCKIRIGKIMPEKLKPIGAGKTETEQLCKIPSVAELGLAELPMHPKSAFPFSGGETSALERVQTYLWKSGAVENYKATRNGLIGTEYSTKFSCWLANGSLSPRKIFYEIKEYEKTRAKNDSTYWVIFELLWRDYFRFVSLKYGNRIFYPGGIMNRRYNWVNDMEKFAKWKDGNTGVPLVDANMRELVQTGWMSNRGRQNVASFLVKDLNLDWRLGAEWFEYLLTDYDVCSNYGNWNYSAGIGNDPRQDRKFNMIKQAIDYDPEGDYIRVWVSELTVIPGGKIHTPWTLSPHGLNGIKLGTDYPHPIIVAQEWKRHYEKAGNSWKSQGIATQKSQRGVDFYFKSSTKK